MPFTDQDRHVIEAVHDAWLDAEVRGDPSALLALCSASPVWLPPDEPPVCGRAAIRAWIAAHAGSRVLRIAIDALAISGLDGHAWKLARFSTTVLGPDASAEIVVKGTHAWLLQRDDAGAWRVAVVTWTIDAG